jgi:hypothetical protein
MKSARGRWATAGSLVAVAILSGCDGHSKPTAISTISATSPSPSASSAAPAASSPVSASASTVPLSSASASPSAASPSPSTSADPSAATETAQKLAAVKVVQEFFAGLNHQTDTGEEGPAIATFTPKCSLCMSEVASLAEGLGGGHTLRGTHLNMVSVDDTFKSAPAIITVFVTESEDAGALLDSNKAIVHSYPSVPPTQLAFQVALDGEKAQIFQIDHVK